MLRFRVTIDCQPRTKNGQPPHSTTGADSTSWIQSDTVGSIQRARAGAIISPIESASTGIVSTRLIQNRRVMSTSSGFGPSSAANSTGSSAMPHFGQLPGPSWRISGCIGHVYVRVSCGSGGAAGFGAKNVIGSATNRSRQLGLQNQYVVPACSALPPSASPGITSMPHTGSITTAEAAAAPWSSGVGGLCCVWSMALPLDVEMRSDARTARGVPGRVRRHHGVAPGRHAHGTPRRRGPAMPRG